jgi:hypothetical protein
LLSRRRGRHGTYLIDNANAGATLQAITSTYKTIVEATSLTATPKRIRLYDITFGTLGTPADQTYEWDVSRATTIGTGTVCVPVLIDPADAAAFTVGTANHTVDPTYTASSSVFYLGTNQRASYRWVAAPGSEFVAPATALNGFGLRTRSVSGGTATATGTFLVNEL